jgi:hypothetical protein
VKRTATESLARVALQTPLYNNSGYREPYNPTASGSIDPVVTSQPTSYATMSGTVSHSYSLGTSIQVPQQTSNAYDQQIYSSEDPGMTPTHAAVLAAVPSNATQPSDSYPYAPTHGQTVNNGQQVYPANGYAAQDWRQWTRTYMQPQPVGQPGEYINTATTLMALGRDGGSQDPGNNGHAPLDNPGHVHWPELAFPGAANGHGHMTQQ